MVQQEIDTTDPALWWKQAVVYQVYPRSFKDSRGSGLGSIAGVTEKIDYLAELGVDAIWLSPFYPSQLADGGYDVDDYRNVDPKLGTMDDFDELAKRPRARHQGRGRHRAEPQLQPARMVQGRPRGRPRLPGTRPLYLPRRQGPERRPAAD